MLTAIIPASTPYAFADDMVRRSTLTTVSRELRDAPGGQHRRNTPRSGDPSVNKCLP